MFLSHRTARFYFRKFAQHTIPQHMNSTRSAILLYIELALVLEDEEEDEKITYTHLDEMHVVNLPSLTRRIGIHQLSS